jgi:hypothetical protein
MPCYVLKGHAKPLGRRAVKLLHKVVAPILILLSRGEVM